MRLSLLLLQWLLPNVLHPRHNRNLNHTLKMSSMDGRMINLRSRGHRRIQIILLQDGLRSGSSLKEQVLAPAHHSRGKLRSHQEEGQTEDRKIVRECGLPLQGIARV